MRGYGIRIDRERLVEVARTSGNTTEAIQRLGLGPNAAKRSLLSRFARHGVDVSHFSDVRTRRQGRSPAPDGLREVVRNSLGYADALRRLGRPENTTNRTLLKAWIAEAGLSTEHFLGQAHYRGLIRPERWRRATDVLIRHESERRTPGYLLRRALGEVGVPEVCAGCGTPPSWHGRPMTLEVDHVNGDRRDDRRENLRLLCPNCHAVTDTWCRGGARRTRIRPPEAMVHGTA
ncbi:HNH endonuclease [Streptomyces sp. BI20]|uniref:HNH endonuclease signature motif containing protein n=1 Tax=Streptomyces sp. BI20 TaxID=3403460 RepID=UPI003C7663EE